MSPRVPFRIVRGSRELAMFVALLPMRCALRVGAVARGTMLLVDRATRIERRRFVARAHYRNMVCHGNHRAHTNLRIHLVPGATLVLAAEQDPVVIYSIEGAGTRKRKRYHLGARRRHLNPVLSAFRP